MLGLFKRWRRKRLAKRPFPKAWLPILAGKLPFYSTYPPAQQEQFRDLLKVFVWEKHFIGAQGMQITDEVRVIIAACAVRLVRFLDLSYYDRLTEIVVYPFVYQHKDMEGAVFGEAHAWGTVVLSWPAVLAGLANPRDGHDTALHEFAHVLDRADGGFDGTPELIASEDYSPWARVMTHHFFHLQKRKKPQRQVLRRYGATNEAEFFAVAVESYFEKPKQMKSKTSELYQVMQDFFGGDPAELPRSK